MNAKPGTPFIVFAIIAPLVVAGVVVLVPHTGTPFDIGSQLLTISFNFGTSDWLPGSIPNWLQWLNPILILCHVGILAGGVAINRGNSESGSLLIIPACAAIIMFVALGYFVAMAMQESHRWDLPDDRDWMVTFGLIAPMFYLISVLVALIRAMYLHGAHRSPTGVR